MATRCRCPSTSCRAQRPDPFAGAIFAISLPRRSPDPMTLSRTSMKRRQFVHHAAASALLGGIARPAIVRAASATTLKFVPYADLALLDPLISAFVTRNLVP
jgi:hypothetical protein